MSHTPPAPREQLRKRLELLEDIRCWLLDRIDGSEETKGDDGLISDFIRKLDALEAQIVSLTQPKTIAEWQAAKSSEIAEPRGCPTPGACSAVAEQTRLRQMAEHERDGILEKLIAATNRALEVAARVADEMTKDVAGGSNVGKAIRNLKEST